MWGFELERGTEIQGGAGQRESKKEGGRRCLKHSFKGSQAAPFQHPHHEQNLGGPDKTQPPLHPSYFYLQLFCKEIEMPSTKFEVVLPYSTSRLKFCMSLRGKFTLSWEGILGSPKCK